jgi:hypothetical protein
VDDDQVCEATAADEAEHAVALRPAKHSRAAGCDDAGYLETRNVGRAARGSRVEARALDQVGRIEAGVARTHEKLVGARNRVGTVLEPDDLVSPRSGEDDGSHAS